MTIFLRLRLMWGVFWFIFFVCCFIFFFSSRRRHTRLVSDWSSDVCSSDLVEGAEVRQDVGNSPCTTSSFAALVRKRFFDGTRFHRIVPGFVIQGGDPTATGKGGPGYSVRDVPASDSRYTKGVVAMAKTAAELPGTSGSQFFVVTAVDAGLPPEYAILGVVTKGLRVVERIGRLGDPVNERPTRRVVVQRVVVTP